MAKPLRRSRAAELHTNVSPNDVIGKAYRVQHQQISGPAWLDSDRFDIASKISDGVSAGGLNIGYGGGRGHLSGRVTMPWFADYLSVRLGRPVLDQTELEGVYAIALDWIPELGLRLVAKKGLVEVLVVDHAEKVPTEN